MTYNELAELFKREGGDAQVCFSVISQNKILFGNNDTKKDIISFKNEEPIKWVKEAQEELVSEDLEEAARDYAGIPKDSPHDLQFCVQDKKAKYDAVIFGANWQKYHMEFNRIQHCNGISNEQAELEQKFLDEHLDRHDRMPTFLDAIEYGMKLQREQMMKQAIEGVARPDDCEVWCNLDSVNLKDGDKVKIVIIK